MKVVQQKDEEISMSDSEMMKQLLDEMHKIADQKVKDQGKVLKFGHAIIMFCIALFLPLIGGLVYYFKDQAATTEKINLVEKRSIEKMGKVETKIAVVEGKLDVVKVTVERTQKDIESIKKNIDDFLLSKSNTKKNKPSFNKTKIALK